MNKTKKRAPSNNPMTRRRNRTTKGTRGKQNDPAPAPLPPELVKATEGMSPEDAAAYVKVQLGRVDVGKSPARSTKTAKPKPSGNRKPSAEPVTAKPKRQPAKSATRKSASQPAPAESKGRSSSRTNVNSKKKGSDGSKSARADSAPSRRQKVANRKRAERTDRQERAEDRPAASGTTTVTVDAPIPPAREAPPKPSASAKPARRSGGRKKAAAPAPAQVAPGIPTLSSGRVMVINNAGDDECRIAVLYDKKLEEIFIERSSSVSHVGNIYKGVVTNVESSIQAAFIDFGLQKHGFLHISDVQPQYFSGASQEPEGVGQKVPRRDRPPIQKCFRRGQEVIVQVIKEGLGTKGPTLSTYLSIPGRYLVMMPGMTRLGVSRKIEDEDARRKMRSVLSELTLPKDMGFILRTAGEGRTKRDLQRDLTYLDRLWTMVVKRVRSARAPAELYRESDLVTRTIRDVFTVDFDGIIVDSEAKAEHAREFLRIALPRTSKEIVQLYQGRDPIFHAYGIEEQIESIHSRQVPLKSGGSIVIDQTEAMVAIDVNSGRLRSPEGEEETAYQTNIEAAKEIARQLRLRDLGGLVVCDFIDMRYDRHKRDVERELRNDLKLHKERARVLRMSQFGLIELTRQRQGPSIKRGIYADCPHCKGSGLIKTPESMTLHVLRNVQKAIHRKDIAKLTIRVSAEVADELQNRKRSAIHQFEQETGKTIIIRAESSYTWDQQVYEAEDTHGRKTRLFVNEN